MEVILTDSTPRTGEPVTWGSGQPRAAIGPQGQQPEQPARANPSNKVVPSQAGIHPSPLLEADLAKIEKANCFMADPI
jgi:hypothetical protein